MDSMILTKKKLAKLNAERKRVENGEISVDDIDIDAGPSAPQTDVHFTPRGRKGSSGRRRRGDKGGDQGCCVVS